MAELGSNGFDPSHLRMVPSSSGSGPNDKRDVTESPLLSFVTCVQGRKEGTSEAVRQRIRLHKVSLLSFLSRACHIHIIKGALTSPRLKGRLFCVHLISVSGTDPLTMHVRLYSISDMSCFGFTLIFTESGFTAGGRERERRRRRLRISSGRHSLSTGRHLRSISRRTLRSTGGTNLVLDAWHL